jgi:ADP-ribose pyrophosphatase YjhB (NUDIX family)
MPVLLVTGCVIEKGGKILLVQEGPEHPNALARGLWNIPAGKVEEKTLILENAVKEVKEETGYDVELDDVIGIYEKIHSTGGNHVIRISFRAHITGGELKFDGKEIGDARWFTPDEIFALPHEKLRGIRETIQDYMTGQSLPLSFVKEYR